MTDLHAPNILMIYPRFLAASFWDFRATCEAVGRRCVGAPLGLITVAALLPSQWNVRLIDRNAEELAESDLSWADLVMTGGMVVQQHDAREIIRMCNERGIPVAVGGPDVTSSPHVYADANFQVRGEAEGVMSDFVAALKGGAKEGIFEAPKFQVDVTKVPIPRFDLLNFRHYLQLGVQFSRGCPFTCEFCDIIELYGRVPRAKTSEQMLSELDALYRLGWRGLVEFVDDNLVGNKKALKGFLPLLTGWLAAHRQPFEFATEASINIADDDDLLRLLREANFFAVFIGIESPETDTLIAVRKKQNTRRDIAASIRKVYAAGITVAAGFIIGFDTEKSSVAKATAALIEDAAIPVCLVSLLAALPHTQLTRRLQNEGRLHPNHEMCVSTDGAHLALGLNFDTLRPRSEIIRDCQTLIRDIFHPTSYFGRVRRATKSLNVYRFRIATPIRQNPDLLVRILWYTIVRNPEIGMEVLKTVMHCLRHNPRSLRVVLRLSAMYLHLGPFSRYLVQLLERHVTADPGAWRQTAVAPQPRLVSAT
jgi:radical SAM superfamily enzyme YgiQ (UPF0313 family)